MISFLDNEHVRHGASLTHATGQAFCGQPPIQKTTGKPWPENTPTPTDINWESDGTDVNCPTCLDTTQPTTYRPTRKPAPHKSAST